MDNLVNPVRTECLSYGYRRGSNGVKVLLLVMVLMMGITASVVYAQSADSEPFNITPDVAASVNWTTQPNASYAVGAPITVAVTVKDQFGNNVIDGTTVTIDSNKGVLNGTKSRTTTAGVATFNDLSITTPDTGYNLTATSNGIDSVPSSNFEITSGTATKLLFTTQPVSTVAGATLANIVVTVQDNLGNTVIDATTSITLTPSAGTLFGIRNKNAVSGIATFSGLSMTLVGTGYTLTTTNNEGLTNDTSTVFDISPAAAAVLAFTAQPSETVAGVTMNTVTVEARDTYDNLVPNVAVSLTLTGALLNGTTTTTTNASGLATFNNLSITTTNTYQLAARAGAVGPVNSNNFTITAADQRILAFVQQPTTAVAGATITPDVTVSVHDQYDNPVPGVEIYMSVLGGSPALLGTSPRTTDANGIATFNDLYIEVAGTGYQLNASITEP